MIQFKRLSAEATPEMVGLIPTFLDPDDPRPAREQLDANYSFGGGWSPLPGFTYREDDRSIKYPGDPRMLPLAGAKLRHETILVYPHAWVLILQKDGSFEIARMD
jgi:hypothetical protein